MTGNQAWAPSVRETLLADLIDAALEVASRHGVRGPSVDQEVELWHALQNAARQPTTPCDLVAALTEAAYGVALGHGFRGPFTELELELWRTMRRVLVRNRKAAWAVA